MANCTISRETFRAAAKPLKAVINCKQTVDMGGNLVVCQVAVQLTIVGSKELPQS